MKTIDEERKEFEASYRKALLIREDELKGLFDEIALSGTDYREYAHTQVQIAWEVWQAARNQSNNVPVEPLSEWLETEISAIDTWYRGSPSYAHDASWFKNEVLEFITKHKSVIDSYPSPHSNALEMAKDAERYRFLRADGVFVKPELAYIPSVHGEALDTLIDLAMAKDDDLIPQPAEPTQPESEGK